MGSFPFMLKVLIRVDRSRLGLYCKIAQMDKHAGASMMSVLKRRRDNSLQFLSARA